MSVVGISIGVWAGQLGMHACPQAFSVLQAKFWWAGFRDGGHCRSTCESGEYSSFRQLDDINTYTTPFVLPVFKDRLEFSLLCCTICVYMRIICYLSKHVHVLCTCNNLIRILSHMHASMQPDILHMQTDPGRTCDLLLLLALAFTSAHSAQAAK